MKLENLTSKIEINLHSLFFTLASALFSIPLLSQSILSDTTIVIRSENILFPSAEYKLDSSAMHIIKSIYSGDTIYKYFLSGHTDSDGTASYNLELSKNRVLQVSNFLTDSLGLDSSRIVISYEGEMEPLATNINSDGKRKNRRVSVEKFLPVRVRYISGVIKSKDTQPIIDGHIYLHTRYYRDSIDSDSLGKFTIAAPEGSFIRLDATAKDHFYIDTLLKVTSQLTKDPIQLSIPYLAENQRYKLPEMFFVGDQDVLLSRSLSSLAALTKTMQKSEVCAIIEGHVNRPGVLPQNPGTFSFNLSVARAMKIRNHLIQYGVDSLRINPIGFSNWYMTFPYATSGQEQELNRRVEMVIKNCEDLFEFSQKDLIQPQDIGTTKRLIKKK